MPVLAALSAALAWLGRPRARAIAAVVFIAIAVPPFDALLKPYVPEAIFTLLFVAFVRIETADLRSQLRKPGLLVAATVWTSLVIPMLIGIACLALKVHTRPPHLFIG